MTTTESCETAVAEIFEADADRVFGALSHADRRFVVGRLVEGPGEAKLTDLATELAAWKGDEGASDSSDSTVESAHASLYHCHVPKLADAGVLTYDRDRGVVALAADAEPVRERVALPAIDG